MTSLDKKAVPELEAKFADWRNTVPGNGNRGSRARNGDGKRVREADDMIQLLLDTSAEAIYGIDLEGNCTLANPVCAKLLGYSDAGELAGKNMHAFLHRPGPAGAAFQPEPDSVASLPQTSDVGKVLCDIFRRADGSRIDVEYRFYPIRSDGEVIGQLMVFVDITDRLHRDEQFRQSQKMEALGQLAGGVAHDFNNLLIIITGYSELLLNTLGPGDPSRKALEEIRKAGERSASLTRQLMAFSRKQVLASKILDLNGVVRDTESLLQRIIGEDITLVSALHARLDPVKADAGQMEQVLLNLVINAKDAMPEGGEITIETENVELGCDCAGLHRDLRPGSYVRLSVKDSGKGMQPEVLKRIFEPFYTTKLPGKGTGLGLAVVHGAVAQSGGCIVVESQPGLGTAFRIYLPRADAYPLADGVLPGLEDSPRGTETVLVVEDEASVRALLGTVLQESGYTVLEAGGVDEAIRVSSGYQGPIHLLITDVVMPDKDGRKLAEKLLTQFPKLKVLYLSGYTDDSVIRHGIHQEKVHFLQKPFSPSVLAHKVREILSNDASAALEFV